MGVSENKVHILQEYRELRANSIGASVTAALGEMHCQEIIGAHVFAFAPKRSKKRRPMLMRNPLALLPFLDASPVRADVCGHFGQRPPTLKEFVKRSHRAQCATDELSGQAPPKIPMTDSEALRTISPMGRGVTPVKFRTEMARRLSSARVVAGYQTKKQAADALGVGLDRYEKWETGRTPVPAQYVASVCDLFSVDANYLFGVTPKAARKTA